MGLIKGFLLVVISVLLFVSLLTSGIFLTLGLSLSYDNVNSKITSVATNIVSEQIGQQEIEKYLPLMKTYCEANPDYVFNEQGYNFSLSCENIPNSTEEFIEKTTKSFVGDFYYKEYDCEFWKCLEEEEIPLFLVSEYAQDYWFSKFYTLLIISLILFALVILLASKKSNGFILTGSLSVVVSLIISKLNTIGTKIANMIMKPVAGTITGLDSQSIISEIVSVFFSKSSRVFLIIFVIGLVLMGVGILFKIFKIGFKISKLFRKGEKVFEKLESSSNTNQSKKDSEKKLIQEKDTSSKPEKIETTIKNKTSKVKKR